MSLDLIRPSSYCRQVVKTTGSSGPAREIKLNASGRYSDPPDAIGEIARPSYLEAIIS